MVTVVFDAGGRTVGDLLELPWTAEAWSKLRSTPQGCVHWQQWIRDHDRAVAILKGSPAVRAEPAITHCEVQVMLNTAAKNRHVMHELYKLKRAETPALLNKDFLPIVTPPRLSSRSGSDNHNGGGGAEVAIDEESHLDAAAEKGMICTVERLLLTPGSRSHPDDPRGKAGYTGESPLYLGAQNGHLDVVAALLGAKADPNYVSAENVVCPISGASRHGH
jgi:hypothetical protein